jgi:3-deoxy-D-manno-octulosonic-acid transferase
MGELLLLLGVADIALIGGSLVKHGGNNVLEPAVWGVPVVTGPHMFNFSDISRMLVDADAMVQLPDPALLPETLLDLALDPQRRATMGTAGRQVVRDNRGAMDRLLALVESVYPLAP